MASVQLLRCFIDGQWVETDQRFSNVNPVNGEVFAQVCEADAATVQQAIQAANRACSGPWRQFSTAERAAALRRIADGIAQRFEAFVQAELMDTGRPVPQGRSLDGARGIANSRTFAALMTTPSRDMSDSAAPDGANFIND